MNASDPASFPHRPSIPSRTHPSSSLTPQANQCFFSTYFLIAFIPTITAPLVAAAAGSGDTAAAADRVCEALFLASVLGAVGTLILVAAPQWVLGLVLPAGAPAAEYATRYLRLRALSLIPVRGGGGGREGCQAEGAIAETVLRLGGSWASSSPLPASSCPASVDSPLTLPPLASSSCRP
jgi:hypothetical protein